MSTIDHIDTPVDTSEYSEPTASQRIAFAIAKKQLDQVQSDISYAISVQMESGHITKLEDKASALQEQLDSLPIVQTAD